MIKLRWSLVWVLLIKLWWSLVWVLLSSNYSDLWSGFFSVGSNYSDLWSGFHSVWSVRSWLTCAFAVVLPGFYDKKTCFQFRVLVAFLTRKWSVAHPVELHFNFCFCVNEILYCLQTFTWNTTTFWSFLYLTKHYTVIVCKSYNPGPFFVVFAQPLQFSACILCS